MTRNGTAKSVSRNSGATWNRKNTEKNHFSCSDGHEQGCQPHPIDPYYAISDNHQYIEGLNCRVFFK